MRGTDGLHLVSPFLGSRRQQVKLREDGFGVGRQHLAALMRRMGIEALHRKRRASPPNRRHKVFPYLLKDVSIVRLNLS